MKKIALFIALLVVFSGTPSVFAETTTSASVQAQINSINSLNEQIKALQAERKTLVSSLITQLRQGSSGDAVTTLQTLLALDPSIYPEAKITGFFGKLTSEAVKRLQKKYGLAQVGNVGPKTLEKLRKLADDNDLTAENDDNDRDHGKRLCTIIPPGHMIAKGWLKKNDRPIIPTCQTLPKGIKDKLDGHHDDEDNDDDSDNNDTTAPTISEVETNSITTTSVRIKWHTNEYSNSKVWYSTTSGVVTTGAANITSNSLVKSHSVTVSSLSANTVYYFVVGSIDTSGNSSVSAQGTFTTLVLDTTGPVISNLVSSDITATGAKITWTTNESAKDKIWYGTVDPVVTSGSANQEDTSLDTSHSFTLTSLSASTIYFYKVSSTDGSGNVTMSSQGMFTTPAI